MVLLTWRFARFYPHQKQLFWLTCLNFAGLYDLFNGLIIECPNLYLRSVDRGPIDRAGFDFRLAIIYRIDFSKFVPASFACLCYRFTVVS